MKYNFKYEQFKNNQFRYAPNVLLDERVSNKRINWRAK